MTESSVPIPVHNPNETKRSDMGGAKVQRYKLGKTFVHHYRQYHPELFAKRSHRNRLFRSLRHEEIRVNDQITSRNHLPGSNARNGLDGAA